MSTSGPVTTGIALATTLQVAKQAQDFLAAVTGHPGESIGTILGSAVKRRLDNVEAVSSKAQFILLNIGVKAKEIPLHILQPALEAASVQEDAFLQDTWANLLAQAADPRQKYGIEPSFPDTLKGLSSREVKFLDSLFQQASDTNLKMDLMGLKNTYVAIGLRRNPAPPTASHIQLPEVFDADDTREFFLMMDILDKAKLIETSEDLPVLTYKFTYYGFAFVCACQPPKA